VAPVDATGIPTARGDNNVSGAGGLDVIARLRQGELERFRGPSGVLNGTRPEGQSFRERLPTPRLAMMGLALRPTPERDVRA
jgi:hypothetical protein